MKYLKKPIVVEAEQWFPGKPVAGVCLGADCDCPIEVAPHVHTLEGPLIVSEGDMIITGVKGERYPCKPDIFALTYEKAENSLPATISKLSLQYGDVILVRGDDIDLKEVCDAACAAGGFHTVLRIRERDEVRAAERADYYELFHHSVVDESEHRVDQEGRRQGVSNQSAREVEGTRHAGRVRKEPGDATNRGELMPLEWCKHIKQAGLGWIFLEGTAAQTLLMPDEWGSCPACRAANPTVPTIQGVPTDVWRRNFFVERCRQHFPWFTEDHERLIRAFLETFEVQVRLDENEACARAVRARMQTK